MKDKEVGSSGHDGLICLGDCVLLESPEIQLALYTFSIASLLGQGNQLEGDEY